MRTLDHAACARAIFESIGGGENLVSAAHCATRLRLEWQMRTRSIKNGWRASRA